MTLTEARDALAKQYRDAGKSPNPVIGVNAGIDLLVIYVNKKSPTYIPEESKPGVGYEGFRCVSYLGLSTVISDSGPIP